MKDMSLKLRESNHIEDAGILLLVALSEFNPAKQAGQTSV
jgi:hypothetical protein